MIRRELVVPVDPAELWDELTDPERVRSWFGAEVGWDLRPGGPLRSVDDEDGSVRHGRVEVVAPERELRFRWWPEDDDGGTASEVTYRLAPDDGGTRFAVVERPVARPATTARASAVSGGSGWSAWDERLAGLWGRLALAAGCRRA